MKSRAGLSLILIVLAASLVAPGACLADIMITVVADAAPTATLVTLKAGQTATFDVVVSGLDTANKQQLAIVSAEIDFDSTLLGTPFNVRAGSIIPNPNNFSGPVGAGQANVVFDDSFDFSTQGTSATTLPITTNGTLFKFDVTATLGTSPNQGVFTLANPAVALDPNSNFINVTSGTNVKYNVVPAGNGVPEPSSLLMVAMGIASCSGWKWRASKRSQGR